MTGIIDGKAFAAELRGCVATAVSHLESSHGLIPGLAVVLVGEDPASEVMSETRANRLWKLVWHRLNTDCLIRQPSANFWC